MTRLVKVLSLDGELPGEDEWSQQFKRLEESSGKSALLKVSFEKIENRRGFINWLQAIWGPDSLMRLSTYTKRTGARPVMVRGTEAGLTVPWESIDDDFKPISMGRIDIVIGDNDLSVFRLDAKGGPMRGQLPGEDQLLQRLIEGIEATVYNKGYAVRLGEIPESEASAVAIPVQVQQAPAVEMPAPVIPPSPFAADGPVDGVPPSPPVRPRRKKRSKL